MLLFYLYQMMLLSFRFYKRDTFKGHVMRFLKVLILIFLFLPACRTTRDTVVPQISLKGSDTKPSQYSDEVAMKFPDSEPAEKPGTKTEAVEKPVRETQPEEIEVEEAPVVEEVEVELQEMEMESEADEWVSEYYMRTLTIEQKIGQRFIAHIKGKKLTKQTMKLIRNDFISGIILYPWNVEDPEQVKQLTASVQQITEKNDPSVGLFICVDQEGGRVNAFDFGELSRFPAPYYWAQYDDPFYVESAAYIICREILDLGCNMNFAPVLDVYGVPDKTVIGDRSMGGDPEAIGRYGISYIQGAERAGVIPVVKHFPGHGYTNIDSHIDLPVVDLSADELYEWDMKPFRMAIENGAEAIMTSHVLYSSLDADYPATLSSKILHEILREQYGFQGVIISDGIAMGALSNNFNLTETLKLSFQAGIDLILVHSKYDISELKKKVYRLYRQGEITEEQIDRGVRRVLELKLKYGLLPDAV